MNVRQRHGGHSFRRCWKTYGIQFLLFIPPVSAASQTLENIEKTYSDGTIMERYFIKKNASGATIRDSLYCEFHNNGENCAKISYSNGIVEKKEYFAPDAVIDSMFKAIENKPEKKMSGNSSLVSPARSR
jgi:hypothetical protein